MRAQVRQTAEQGARTHGKLVLEDADLRLVLDRISPDPRNFPHVDLTICNDVASCRGKMAVHAGADAIDRLSHINRHLIEVTKHIAADFIRQRANRFPTERQIDGDLYSAAIVSAALFSCSIGSRICAAMCRTTGTQTPSPQT
jgi:hypothetical protein